MVPYKLLHVNRLNLKGHLQVDLHPRRYYLPGQAQLAVGAPGSRSRSPPLDSLHVKPTLPPGVKKHHATFGD